MRTNPKIINVGYQDDVRPYFAIANCQVFPSHREGFQMWFYKQNWTQV
jgi:hypothetical protein